MVNFYKINADKFVNRSLGNQIQARKFKELVMLNTWNLGMCTVYDINTDEPIKLDKYTVERLVCADNLIVDEKLRVSFCGSHSWYLEDILESTGSYLSIGGGNYVDTLDFQMAKLNILLNLPTPFTDEVNTIRNQVLKFVSNWESGVLDEIELFEDFSKKYIKFISNIETREDFKEIWKHLFPVNTQETELVIKSYLVTYILVTKLCNQYQVESLLGSVDRN